MFSSAFVEWITPEWLLERVRRDLSLVLDVCAKPETARAASFITPEEDGLVASWTGRLDPDLADPGKPAAWWCNPPYGRAHGGRWAEKAIAEGKRSRGVLLVPARTETRWFRALARAGEVGFLPGRLYFKRPGAPPGQDEEAAPFPSALVWLGPDVWPGTRWLDWRAPKK